MSTSREDPRDPELERALSRVGRPAARAAFKAELRARFLAVDPDLRDELYLRRAAPPRAVEPQRRPWTSLVLAAAAAALLIVVFALRPRGPGWRLVDPGPGGHGLVRIDGRSIRTDDREALSAALVEATSFRTGEQGLRLALGDLMLVELGPETEISLSSSDKRGRAEPISIAASRGALRLITGPGFAGSQVTIGTGDLALRVTGTAFSVDVLEGVPGPGTCVCCLEGSIEMRPTHATGRTQLVTGGRMCIVHGDDARPETWGEVYEPHAAPLRELDRIARELWRQ